MEGYFSPDLGPCGLALPIELMQGQVDPAVWYMLALKRPPEAETLLWGPLRRIGSNASPCKE